MPLETMLGRLEVAGIPSLKKTVVKQQSIAVTFGKQ
jgi:hypothetical protein